MSLATAYQDLPALLMNPILTGAWDRVLYPIAWPRQGFKPPAPSGDQDAPRLWLEFAWDVVDFQYMSAATGHMFVDVDVAFMLEPVTRAGAGQLVEKQMDALAVDLKAGDVEGQITFRTQESRATHVGDDGGWDRTDWVCPVWYFPGA